MIDKYPVHGLPINYHAVCDDYSVSRIAKAKGRKVRDCVMMAGADTGDNIFIVLFEPKDDKYLSSLVLVNPRELVFDDDDDYQGFDDMIRLFPEFYEINFVRGDAENTQLSYSYQGEEGNWPILQSKDGDKLKCVVVNSRYTMAL